MPSANRHKLFRDPVHNIITLNMSDDVEHVIWQLICTRTMQRLRRIRQMGFAHMVYHGAEHSRFAHSLGVFHVARRIIDGLKQRGESISDEDRLEVFCAALLHDVGHGPFSHAIERVTHVHHEAYTAQLILDPASEVFAVLTQASPDLPERVARYFQDEHFPRERQHLKDIVSSQLDADRLDYILRDGQATGVKIGVYDFERIQAMFELYHGHDERGELRRLTVSYRAREAIEGYLIARFHMYKQVYLHKAVRAAEKMLEAAFARASELYLDGQRFDDSPGLGMDALLRRQHIPLDQFLALDDTDVWMMLKSWSRHEDVTLARLATGLIDRRLYKIIELDREDPVMAARVIDRATILARSMGYEPQYTVLPDRAQNTPYQPYNPNTAYGSGAYIPILDWRGELSPIDHHSDLIHLLGSDSYKIWRLCVPAPLREALEATSPTSR